jgi:PTH1 family peptidyl-tRNA hydrolase
MKLFVGLGNPGKEYEQTRHNAGATFIDFLAKQNNVSFISKFRSLYAEFQHNGEKVILLKPQTFMNASGSAVLECAKFYKIGVEDIIIAFDDLDIKQGDFKIQKGKYPKVHNGVNDILQKLSTDQFWFVRIGIDNRTEIERQFIAGRDYVLQKTDGKYDEIFASITAELKSKELY